MSNDNKPAAAQEAVALYYVANVEQGGDFNYIPISMFDQPAIFATEEKAKAFCDFANGAGSKHEVRTFAAPVAAAPVVTADEREWLQYAIDHMRDDSEPEDVTCANVLEAMLERMDSDDRNPIADLVSGMSVSVDVDRLFDTDGRRLFGTVTEAMWDRDDKHGLTLLVQDAEPNWDASTPAAPGIDLTPFRLLVEGCEAEYTSDVTERMEPDDSKVSVPEYLCSITFGMIRNARKALDASPKGGSRGRYFCDGPEGHFFCDDLKLARDLVNGYDKDDDWTITDLQATSAEVKS